MALLSRLLVSFTGPVAEVFQSLVSREHVACSVRGVYLELLVRCRQFHGGVHQLVLSRLPGCDRRLQHTQVVTHKEISMMSTLVATCTNR